MICIKCGNIGNSQDSSEWEKLTDLGEKPTEKTLWFCPNCIYKTTIVLRFKETISDKQAEINELIKQLQKMEDYINYLVSKKWWQFWKN